LPEGWGISTKKDSREELIERQSNKNARPTSRMIKGIATR